MKNRRSIVTLLLAASVLLIGVIVSFYLSTMEYNAAPVIVLPEKTDGTIVIDDTIRKENSRIVTEVSVDKSNVKQLLSRLKRPPNYTFSSTTEVFNQDNSVSNIAQGYVKGNMAKIIQYEGATPAVDILIAQEYVYSWIHGSKSFYRTGIGSFNYDDMAHLPTYEELLSRDIHSAELVHENEGLCLKVISINTSTMLEETYIIGVYNGLLKRMEIRKDGMLTAKAEITAVTSENLEENLFVLPNGLVPTA